MTKQIKLDDQFSVTSDGKQWTLRYSVQREDTDKDGNKKMVTSADEWYCGSTSTMLKLYVDKALKKSDAGSIEELIEKVDALSAKIDELWASKQVAHAVIPKKLKFAVDPPESADEEEDDAAVFPFTDFEDGVADVLGDMF